MSDLAKIRAKLAALRAKTVENGCTEAEALAAAEKAAELMDAHDLTSAELEAPTYDEAGVEIGRRRTAIDNIWLSVARFAGCTGYLDRTANGRWRFVYFGRSADVLIAEYVHEVIRRAADGAIGRFKLSDDYRRRRTAKTRLRALNAFAHGFASAMAAKLHAGLWRRLQAQHGNGVGLVVQHNEDMLKAELARRGMEFRPTRALQSAGARYNQDAASGFVAGRGVAIDAAVSGAATPVAGLLT